MEDLLARLERERLEADRLYNAALTRVDRAIQKVPRLPAAPRGDDAARLAQLNAGWDPLPDGPPPIDGSIGGRLRGLIWKVVGPPLLRQQQFNSALVDHLNRNVAAHEEQAQAAAALLAAVGQELAALVSFESQLVQYLQTITAYVDTKDRSLGGSELRERLALTEQRLLALKRDVERSMAGSAAGRGTASPVAAAAAHAGPPPPGGAAFDGAVDSLTYVGFEDRFRGAREEIARRVEGYLPIFAGATGVVDVGCGRGEMLEALNANGVAARGVDSNQAMVELCRSHGLDVEQGDALEYLTRQSDGSIGGLVAIQVVEHFAPAYLLRFLETAYHRMRPGAPLVLETLNPACWMAFFETYIRDLTHQRPLHPDTLRYLVQASGFSQVDVSFRQPVRDADRLPRVAEPTPAAGGGPFAELAAVVNAHADRLNDRLFSSMDYVVVARR